MLLLVAMHYFIVRALSRVQSIEVLIKKASFTGKAPGLVYLLLSVSLLMRTVSTCVWY